MKTTAHTQTFNGIPCLVPNIVEETKENFYISYNNYDVGIYGCYTTAVVVGQMQGFFILNGDHRDNLRDKSWNQVREYLYDRKDELNKYSDSLPVGETIEDAIKECKIEIPS